jgi:hypothetical protein
MPEQGRQQPTSASQDITSMVLDTLITASNSYHMRQLTSRASLLRTQREKTEKTRLQQWQLAKKATKASDVLARRLQRTRGEHDTIPPISPTKAVVLGNWNCQLVHNQPQVVHQVPPALNIRPGSVSINQPIECLG